MKKILFVYSYSCKPSQYIGTALWHINSLGVQLDRVFINDYVSYDDSEYDCLIYNTFANENQVRKFYKKAVDVTDEKYHKFKGMKILLDSHDSAILDGFNRFNDKTTPRIKIQGGHDFIKEYNVIATATLRSWFANTYSGEEKIVPLIYCGNKGPFQHKIRELTLERLKPFNPITKKFSLRNYGNLLRSAKISVGVPGWGEVGSSHIDSVATKCALFSHESIKSVKMFPFADLIDNYNYISYNFDNIEDRMRELIQDEDKIKFIAENGYEYFKEGYNPQRTGQEILNYIRTNL